MKDTELITFESRDVGELRGFIKDGEPWFLAGQVCRCLGIKDSSTAIQQVKDRMKIAEYKGAVSNRILLHTAGGKQKVVVIPEPFLYELIFASRKQKAIKFRTWVTTEVLPSLRKHGEYRINTKIITKDLHEGIQSKILPKIESETGKKFAFSTFHKLINKSLGLPDKNNRDELSDEMLEKLAIRENLVMALIDEGKTYSQIKEVIEGLR